jgi:hypothetical protein
LKSVNNEGSITVEDETVFRPYLSSHRGGLTEIGNAALTAHALRAVQFSFKSISNEGHFTL